VNYREIKFGALLERLPQDTKLEQGSWFATGTIKLSSCLNFRSNFPQVITRQKHGPNTVQALVQSFYVPLTVSKIKLIFYLPSLRWASGGPSFLLGILRNLKLEN